MHRRRFLVAAVAGAMASSAGCVGGHLEELTTHTATPATVDDDALERTGYEHRETEKRVREERLSGETVEVTNYLTRFRRTVELAIVGEIEAGVFGVLSTPKVSIAGREFNPIDDMDRRELAERVQAQYAELGIGEVVDEREARASASPATVHSFAGEATVEGREVSVLVDVCRFELEANHLVAVGIYPEVLPEAAERVRTMIDGVELEGDAQRPSAAASERPLASAPTR